MTYLKNRVPQLGRQAHMRQEHFARPLVSVPEQPQSFAVVLQGYKMRLHRVTKAWPPVKDHAEP